MGCKYAWTWIHFSVNFFHHSAMGWESTWLHWFLQRCTICKKVAEWRWVQNASCFAPCFYNTDGQPAVNFDSHYPHEMLRNWNGLLARSVPWNYSSLGSVLDLTTGRHWHRAVGKFERLHQPRPPLGYVYVQFMFFAQKDTDHFPGSKPYLVWLAFLYLHKHQKACLLAWTIRTIRRLDSTVFFPGQSDPPNTYHTVLQEM